MNFYKTTTQLKTEARGLMLEKYGTYIAALAFMELILIGITSVISFVLPADTIWGTILEFVLSLIVDLIGAVFSLGLIHFTLNICRNQPYKVSDILHGFSSHPDKAIITCFLFGVAELVCLLPTILFGILFYITENMVLMLVTSVFLVIGMILVVIIHVTYDFMYYLMLDYPNATLKECFHYCGEVMKGHRVRLFYLRASFLPLYLLSILSMGIGFLFILPYENVAVAKFYLDVFHPDQLENEAAEADKVDGETCVSVDVASIDDENSVSVDAASIDDENSVSVDAASIYDEFASVDETEVSYEEIE